MNVALFARCLQQFCKAVCSLQVVNYVIKQHTAGTFLDKYDVDLPKVCVYVS